MAQLTVTLSTELADKVRSRAASQGYASENTFVEEHLTDALELDPELEHWLATVGVARYDAYDANPKDIYTSEEVLRHLDDRLKGLPNAG